MLENEEFIAWANENAVVLVGHPKGSHKSTDVPKPAKGEPKSQCSLYPGISCEQHEKVFADVTGREPGEGKDDDKPKPKPRPKKDAAKDEPPLPTLEVKGYPTSFVIAPDGTSEVHKADREPGACKDGILAVQKKFDENPVPLAKWTEYQKAFADGDKAWKAGKTKPALLAFAKVDADAAHLAKVVAEKLKTRLDAIAEKAATRLAAVRKISDPAAQAKAAAALRAELDVPLSTPLAVVAELDALCGAPPAPDSK